MNLDDPAVRAIVRASRVARIATLSGSGRPSITALYFINLRGQIWLGTSDWTLAAREARADPRVSVLLARDLPPHGPPIVRVAGRATVRTDAAAQRAYVLRVALKYSLSPGQLRNTLAHLRLVPLRRRYHQQSAARGALCILAVAPERVELLAG